MTKITPKDQGRAPGLYDEQLQRQLQEKLLAKKPRAASGGKQTAPFVLARSGSVLPLRQGAPARGAPA